MDYCCREILTMEYLKGTSFVDAVKASFSELAESQGKSFEDIEREQTELIKSGKFVYKSIDEESRLMKKYQYLLYAKSVSINALKMAYNWTFGLVIGSVPYTEPLKVLNLGEIIRTLSLVHAHEIMIDGAFNG